MTSVGLFVPWRCNFYDLDFDGIPEVVVYFGGVIPSGMGWKEVFKLYGTTYEMIATLDSGEYNEVVYINPHNKVVTINPESTREIKIIDKKLIYSEYIDSTGSDTYDGKKYDDIGNYSEYFNFPSYEDSLNRDIFLADLSRFPEFDCSDVLKSITNTPMSPQTSDMNMMLFIILGLTSVVLFCTVKKNKIISCNKSIEKQKKL